MTSAVISVTYLHDADDGPTVIREVVDPSHHVGGVEESLSVGRQEHEQANHRDRRRLHQSGDRSPQEEVPHEALDCPRQVHHPGPPNSAAVKRDRGVQNPG